MQDHFHPTHQIKELQHFYKAEIANKENVSEHFSQNTCITTTFYKYKKVISGL